MKSQLRRMAIQHQGLAQYNIFGKGLRGTRQAIEHLGYVQIDTISVVERAHHHVLLNRVSDYDSSHLNKLLQEKSIFEYWYHAASYLPIRDYRFSLANMDLIRQGKSRYFSRGDSHFMKEILAQVKAEGTIRLRDVVGGAKVQKQGWWNSAPGRRAIEQLFMQGDLMVCERHGMEKIYTLTENFLPNHVDLSRPSLADYALHLLDTTRRSHGVFTWKKLLHLKVGAEIRAAMRKAVDEQIEAGLIKTYVDLDGQTFYVNCANLEDQATITPCVKILSPFDDFVIHRDRMSLLFDFEYRLECYVPLEKRIYGYFSLPILFGDQLVARINCKAYRMKKELDIISIHLEKNITHVETFFLNLYQELQRFAKFNQCELNHKISIQSLQNLV